jgi:hypothetical protein
MSTFQIYLLTCHQWRSALYAKKQMNTQNFAKYRSFLLFVRKRIELRLGLHRIICIFKYPIIFVNFAVTKIPENTVFPYITLIHTFFYIWIWVYYKKMSIQSNLKSVLKAKQTESRMDHDITNERTCSEVNSKLTRPSPGSCSPEYSDIEGLKQA